MDKGQRWMMYSIRVYPLKKLEKPDEWGNRYTTNHYHSHLLKVFDYPDWILQKKRWFLEYYVAKFKVRFPRNYINLSCCCYYPDETNEERQKKLKISAARAQVSKVKGVMELRRKELAKQLFQDEENDPVMIMCREKLKEKEFKLQQALMD